MNFSFTSPKGFKALTDALKGLPTLQARLAASLVHGKAPEVQIDMTCDHTVIDVKLEEGFSGLSLDGQAAALREALQDAKHKVDLEIVKLAGPLAEMLVKKPH